MAHSYRFFIFALLTAGLRAQSIQHVVVFGVDGLSPRGITANDAPAMHRLMSEGVWTLSARAVIPTVSSPNWAAMIMGASPDMTGITSNEWQPQKFDIAPACSDAPGIYPTIFQVLRRKGVNGIGVFTDWADFARLIEPGVADRLVKQEGRADEIMKAALNYLAQAKPAMTFIHLDIVDDAGHEHGWYGAEYQAAIRRADSFLAEVRQTLNRENLADSTIVLLTADHGGHERKHGSMLMSDVLVPWIAAGPGLPANQEIKGPVSTTQTAPTVAAWLGASQDPCWMARPIILPGNGR